MCLKNILSISVLILVSVISANSLAEPVVKAFKGSVEKGVYESRFEAFSFIVANGKKPDQKKVEGSLISRVLEKPEDRSNLEVFRSYEQELSKNGFKILYAATPSERNPRRLIWSLYRSPANDINKRRYKKGKHVEGSASSYINSFGDYYLSASRTQGDVTLYVALVISAKKNFYLLDELTTAAMETGTVSLNLEAMRSSIEDTGKIAVYDVHFATGSANIEPSSAGALAVIASYLKETKGGYYIVGHTDDTGSLKQNLTLSTARAAAVKRALVADYGVQKDRLHTSGVGPLAPVSNNSGKAGRTLNRRVEIVQRLNNR